MSRIKGAVDADHQAKKSRLQERLLRALAKAKGHHPSYRELAVAAGVSQTTLRHYFGGMDDLIVGIFYDYLKAGAPHIQAMAQANGPFPKSMVEAVNRLAFGLRLPGLHGLRAIGQTEGIRRDRVGAAYLQAFIDPCIQAVQTRLETHMQKGEMRKGNARIAAISLVAPIIFTFQHQDDFGGSKHSQLEIPLFLKEHTQAFIRAHGTGAVKKISGGVRTSKRN